MSIETKLNNKPGEARLVLTDEPGYILALPEVAEFTAPLLQSGLWIIANIASYSGPDIQNIGEQIAAVKKFNGRVSLAIRVIDDVEKLQEWLPEIKARYQSPVLLFIDQAKLVGEVVGAFHQNMIAEKIAALFDLH